MDGTTEPYRNGLAIDILNQDLPGLTGIFIGLAGAGIGKESGIGLRSCGIVPGLSKDIFKHVRVAVKSLQGAADTLH